MSGQAISLKTVYQLREDGTDQPIRYRIGAYQRGFRWARQQVTQLLDDIREFTRRDNPRPEEFYCLQPLVLKPHADGSYEVVDGQQRLTTLLLIMRHLNERMTEKYRWKIYRLQYETRPDLQEFLGNPSEERAAANIDYFHIAQAIKTIEEWFSDKESELRDIEKAFLHQTKVIWFLLSTGDNAVEAFTRLNVGKIPLTNGELIRALFLRTKGEDGEKRQLQIANEWDLLEKGLQRSDFWHYLSNDKKQSGNRIGFLFDLVARADGMAASTDTYATFYHYSAKLNATDSNPNKEWLAIKQMFMLLEEWFENRRLYHLVGFLIWEGMDVNQLIALAKGKTKKQFRETLRAQIFSRVIGQSDIASRDELEERITEWVDSLEYGRDSAKIRSLLLLFNLATLLEKRESNVRFQFESFKTAVWHIEHVRSVAPDTPGGRQGRIDWLKHCLGYLQSAGEATELQTEIEQFMGLSAADATDAAFETLYEKVLRQFHESDSEPDHSVANLVLLDYETNTSYKNAPFAVKRQRILSLDRHGIFVPLCTRNVFLKCYNPRVDHVMFWTQEDRDGYQKTIIDVLTAFFRGEWIDE